MAGWIFIYGPPGSGKSALAKELARQLALPAYDLDRQIEAQTGQSIEQIFANQGQAGFRQLECDMLQQGLAGEPGVMALGGGALLDAYSRITVQTAGQVIVLNAPFEILLARLQADSTHRPLLEGNTAERLQSLLADRQAHYASFSFQLETSPTPLEELAWQVQIMLGSFHIRGMGTGYDVRVMPGGFAHLGELLQARKLKGPLAVVSDQNVARWHLPIVLDSLHQAGYTAAPLVFPAGEAHKTLSTLQHLWESFLSLGLERSSTVIALGGGVVGDLAGFASAVYLRGVRWVAVPTSLLAMVDASLGGKTGADLPQGKNLIGAFHPPSMVLVDPQVLATLPEDELRNGMAEVVKHGVIGDAVLFEQCQKILQDQDWTALVRRAMAVKIAVILKDPYEQGIRATLNLGHTLGHALELASDFRLRHGEAVSIGLVAATRLAVQMSLAAPLLAEQVVETLKRLGLPVKIPLGLDTQRILEAMQVDKKKAAGKVKLVLPLALGRVQYGIEIADLAEMITMVSGPEEMVYKNS